MFTRVSALLATVFIALIMPPLPEQTEAIEADWAEFTTLEGEPLEPGYILNAEPLTPPNQFVARNREELVRFALDEPAVVRYLSRAEDPAVPMRELVSVQFAVTQTPDDPTVSDVLNRADTLIAQAQAIDIQSDVNELIARLDELEDRLANIQSLVDQINATTDEVNALIERFPRVDTD